MITRLVALKNAYPPATVPTATANGTAFDLGGVLTSETLVGAIQMAPTTCAQKTWAVIIQSATSSAFAAPVTRITFTDIATTAGAAQWVSAAGPFSTDFRFWRAQYTATSSGTFPALVAMGIR